MAVDTIVYLIIVLVVEGITAPEIDDDLSVKCIDLPRPWPK